MRRPRWQRPPVAPPTGRPQVEAASHGDFSMANILDTIDDRIAVVDPNRYAPARILAAQPGH